MAGMKEIRTRIDSVQQTLKITNAMYLISSSKLRKARQQLNRVAPFFAKINETISDILHHTTETQHRFFDKRKYLQERKVGYVVITGDKGLAGAYNHNILRLTEERLAQTDHPVLFLVGQVGRSYFAGRDVSVDKEFLYTAQDPTLLRAEELSDYVIDLFIRGELDEVYVIYTEMVSPMVLEPKVRKMLPLDADAFPWEPRPGEEGLNQQKVTYVPSEAQVLSYLAEGYVKGAIFGTLVESFCAEQNARMMAMDAASSNARDMLKALSLHYNRARQAAITQEITEVVGGDAGPHRPLPGGRQPPIEREEIAMERKGAVAQVLGPVVDVVFPDGKLPEINEAMTVTLGDTQQVMEVAQHIGGDTVRCIMLSPSEGLGRGVEVTATGHTIQAPVGEETLGRMFNVLGQPIDEKGPWRPPPPPGPPPSTRRGPWRPRSGGPSTASPPPLPSRAPPPRSWRRGSRSLTC